MDFQFHMKSGSVLDTATLCPRDIKLEDISHGLSMICRFNGSTIMLYSVAEHCVRASDLVKTKPQKRRVFMHDAAEALGIGDVVSPMKEGMTGFNELESRLQGLIAKKYKFKPDFAKESYIKLVDIAIALAEVRDLLLHNGTKKEFDWWKPYKTPEAMKIANTIPKIYPGIPREAKERFLARAHQLGLS